MYGQFGVLSAETFPLEVRTTGISLVNCSGRIGAICAQFVNGFLVGPPAHIEALLLVVTSVMVAGGIASRSVHSPGGSGGREDESGHLQHGHSSPPGSGRKKLASDDEAESRVGEEDLDSHEIDEVDESDHEDGGIQEEAKRCLRKGDRSAV